MKSTRIIALLLALPTALAAGCGQNAGTIETTETTALNTTDETTSYVPELPDEDYEGYEFAYSPASRAGGYTTTKIWSLMRRTARF